MKEARVVLLAFVAALAGFVLAIGFERELVKLLELSGIPQDDRTVVVVTLEALGVVAEVDPEALGHAVERAAVDAQHLRRAAAVALAPRPARAAR